MSNDEADDYDDLLQNLRGWSDYWYWRDKPVGEVNAAAEVLRGAGIRVENLASRAEGDDPPDCEALLDGEWSGVEVTELLHQPTLERSLKAQKQRAAGKTPKKPEAYFVWDRPALLAILQKIIDTKDYPAKLKGGPYQRYALVVVTNEFFLERGNVSSFLDGATFRARMITDAFLGLSYHPDPEGGRGCCPVFPLRLERR
jgi:hypothetical protein